MRELADVEDRQLAKTEKTIRRQASLNRPRVMPEITKAIASDIFSGRYAPGTSLPTENDLGIEYGVSRTVIREALKVLAAKGLLLSRPRIGTIVCEADNWNIIDPQVLAWHPHGLDEKLFEAILETRRAIEPLVAELAAERATLQEIADLDAAWQRMFDAGGDVPAFSRADIEYHRILYGAGHNPIFRQIGGMIDAALRFSLEATTETAPGRLKQALRAHRAVVDALRLKDGMAARRAAEDILALAGGDPQAAKSRPRE
jgi:DNA-binding FadR family transcriptional regulator